MEEQRQTGAAMYRHRHNLSYGGYKDGRKYSPDSYTKWLMARHSPPPKDFWSQFNENVPRIYVCGDLHQDSEK